MKRIKAVLQLNSGGKIKADFAPVERDGFKQAPPLTATIAGKDFRYAGAMDGVAQYVEVPREKA